jgi:hypothetical protein
LTLITSVEICQRLLDRYNNEGKDLLSRIVTGDEMCVHHYEPESKNQRMAWKHPGSPTKKKFKVMLAVFFFDSKWSILEDYLEKECTALCSALVHTASGAAMFTLSQQQETDAIKVKLRSRDHYSTNFKHACAEGSVTNLKMCYGESADNFYFPT